MKTSINSFWNYFNQHSQKFISQQPFNNECPRAILRELQDLLNQYQPNLGFRLGIKNGEIGGMSERMRLAVESGT